MRLAQAEQNEADPWLRDDIRIAWITVLYASRGDSHPHFWATYRVLGTSPDQVWPRIVARRQANLGKFYLSFFDENGNSRGGDLPEASLKKPARSVTFDEFWQSRKAAA